jgi:hypothetical protein
VRLLFGAAIGSAVACGIGAATRVHDCHHFAGDAVKGGNGKVAAVANEGSAEASSDLANMEDLGNDRHGDLAVDGECSGASADRAGPSPCLR